MTDPDTLSEGANRVRDRRATTREVGEQAERLALSHLEKAGLRLLTRNYRTAGRGGGELDLVMREPDGTLVFVEVRQRVDARFGGAAASVGAVKQRRLVFAARCYLSRLTRCPPCRFDVVAIDRAGDITWIRGAFEA